MSFMLQLTSTTKKFGQKIAVHNMSFEAKSGEIIGFLGPNGAGKTTTMRLILGFLLPSTGEVKINEKNPITKRLETLPNIGYLPENNPLYGEMQVAEYLSFISDIKQDTEEHIYEILDKVNLNDVLTSKIEELSRGFKQRVGLAAALIGDPDILILDEPTSGLDPLEQDNIKELIKKIATDKTIIFSTHILSEVEDIANRIIIVKEGKKVYDGPKPRGKGEVEKLFKKHMKDGEEEIEEEQEEKPKKTRLLAKKKPSVKTKSTKK
jgi:ABC-2 type transport system ATP-binding protein